MKLFMWVVIKFGKRSGSLSGNKNPEFSEMPPGIGLHSINDYKSHYIFAQCGITKNSIRDACTPQPGKIVFNTMRYRRSETVHRLGYFQSSVSVQIMFK